MRVLVTGAGGQVGRELPALLGHHDVLAADHALLDVVDPDRVEQVVGEFAPDAVINCAARTDVDGCEDDEDGAFAANAMGVRHLAVACARAGAHLVHISTDYIFSGDKQTPYDEWDVPGPRSVYGRSKLAGEREVTRHAVSWTIVRTSWVHGRAGRDFVDAVVHRARAGEPLRVVDDQTGSPTYAPDLAAALARMATGRRQGVFHVTNQGTCTWFDLAVEAIGLAGLDPEGVGRQSSAELARPAPRPRNSVLDNRALRVSGLPLLRHYREALAQRMAGATVGDRA